MKTPRLKYKNGFTGDAWPKYWNTQTGRNNDNNLILFAGATGSGKTYSGLATCEKLGALSGRGFSINHVVFGFYELMGLINSGNLRKQDAILYDESQCSSGARDWQSLANKLFNYLISTFRHLNLTLVFCLPSEAMLDKQTRSMIKTRVTTSSINRAKKTCRVNPFYIEYSPTSDKCYTKRLQVSFIDKDGFRKTRKITSWDIPLPSKELILAYEKKKSEFTANLNKNIMAELEKMNDSNNGGITAKQQEAPQPERKALTDKQQEVMEVLADNNYDQASDILGISRSALHQNKELALKKGYSLEEFKKI